MRATQPPRLATAVLKRLASGPKRESLIGDLIEQYQSGRSPVWYWRQVLAAIVAGAVSDLRSHKLLTVRVVIFAWALWWAFGYYLEEPLSRMTGVSVQNWLLVSGHETLRWWWLRLGLPDLLFYQFAYAVIGFLVVRFHRTHRASVLLVYWSSVLCLEMLLLARAFRFGVYFAGHGRAAIMALGIQLIGPLISVLIGGLAGVGSPAMLPVGSQFSE
jgi:hypothetical protein